MDIDREAALRQAFDVGSSVQDAPEPLRAMLPPPPRPADTEELAREVSSHRILLIKRGAVIAVTTLVSIGGAFLIHALVAGTLILTYFFAPTHYLSVQQRGKGTGGDAPTEGGMGQILTEDTQLASPAAVDLKNVMASLGVPDAVPLPPVALPALPERSTAVAAATLIEPPTDAPPLAAIPDDAFGSVKVKPPALPARPGSAIEGPTGQTPRVGRGDPRGDPDFSSEPVFSVTRGDGFGQGQGTGGGTGAGIGIDRGPSGADRPEPDILDSPMPPENARPSWFRINPPTRPVAFSVLILPSGRIGEITIVESSGRPEVDSWYRDVISSWRYTPAVKGGKPIAAIKALSFNGSMR